MNPFIAIQKTLFVAARRRAMTLVEVSIAMGIAAFAAIPIMGILAISTDNMSDSTERSIFTRLYQFGAETAKAAAEDAAPNGWNVSLAFDRDLVACAESDPQAHYKIVSKGADATAPSGVSGTPLQLAWEVTITITDLLKNKELMKRSTLLVKEPVFNQDESAD